MPPLAELQTLCDAEGIALWGVAPCGEGPPERKAAYESFLKEGLHGGMSYLVRHRSAKFAPQVLLPGCRSIVAVAVPYRQAPGVREKAGFGRVAQYAWGRDYHRVVGAALRRITRSLKERYPQERFKWCTDATALEERYYAEQAHLGAVARNGLLVTERFGSYAVLGEILTTLPLEPTEAPERLPSLPCLKGCSKCLEACPTGAITASGPLRAHRCISYLTIEHRGAVPPELRQACGSWLFGCDVCQEVCPLNKRTEYTEVAEFLAHRAGPALSITELLSLSKEAFTERFSGTPLMRAKYEGLLRNACTVAAAIRYQPALPLLENLKECPHSSVAEHAAWALSTLRSK